MLIDRVYQTVQALMNKDQLGYFKPMAFNLFAANAQRKEYNDSFITLKSNVRKMNWMLDGKDFSNVSEHNRQLLEHFSKEVSLPVEPTSYLEGFVVIPNDLEYIEDITLLQTDIRVQKVHYSDYKDLIRNIYANPSECSPICSKVGDRLIIRPKIDRIKLHYLRKPRIPKWTFQEYDGVAYFDSSANDFQDFDLPEASFDNLVLYISEMAGVSIRDAMVVQSANQEQAQKFQTDNQQ